MLTVHRIHHKPLTVRLNDGREVLAKLYKGEPCAVTYANRTQARRKATELGPGWSVIHGLARPFYIWHEPAHVQGTPCPICTKPGDAFPSVHVPGPLCLVCRAPNLETIGTPDNLYYRCPNCDTVRPQGGKEL